MNFAELNDEDDHESKVRMMNVYDRLLRLRTILECDSSFEEECEKHEITEKLENLKTEYLDIVPEVLVGFFKLQDKKDKASLVLSIIDKLGNKDMLYVKQIEELVEQFDKDERITEFAEQLKEKTKKMMTLRRIFSLCAETDIMSNYMCFLCLERPVDIFIDPCGHVICKTCSERSNLLVCPYCRASVRNYKKMFLG
jgi:hypothetical protein